MLYGIAALITLAQQCAPEVASEAVVPLVVAESGGDALALNVNKGPRVRASTIAEGAAIVRRYVAAGYSVDVGLAQINSRNFARLGVTAEQALDPCTNLGLASMVLQENYTIASQTLGGLDAISATYSLYNTGSMTRGFRNGYVDRVWSAAASLGAIPAPPSGPATSASPSLPARTSQTATAWIVGEVDHSAEVVFQ